MICLINNVQCMQYFFMLTAAVCSCSLLSFLTSIVSLVIQFLSSALGQSSLLFRGQCALPSAHCPVCEGRLTEQH